MGEGAPLGRGRGARGYKAASVAVPVGGRDKSQRLPVLCRQRAKIDRRLRVPEGPCTGLGQAAVCSWLGDGRCRPCGSEHELASPLPLPPETLFHRERKGWPCKWLLGPTPHAGPPGVSGCESCGDFAEQAPHGCWAAGPWD